MSDKAKQIKEQIKNGTYALDIETTAEKNCTSYRVRRFLVFKTNFFALS